MKGFDKKFMQMAIKQARLSLKEGELPIGAIVIYKNEYSSQQAVRYRKSLRLFRSAASSGVLTLKASLGQNAKLEFFILLLAQFNKIWGKGRKVVGANMRLDHAEMVALREALDRALKVGDHHLADEMTVYTTLEPCVMCFGAIINSRIARVVFAVEDPYGGACHFSPTFMPIRHKIKFPDVTSGICRSEARKLFSMFFRTTDVKFWQNKENPLVKLVLG